MTAVTRAVLRLVELARWAPSGDNTQPWRFEVVAPNQLTIHGFDTREHCVYDLDGHSSQIAIGALIETLHIAASEQALRLEVTRRDNLPDSQPTFDVLLHPAPDTRPDRLLACIPRRSVCRTAMTSRSLSSHERQALELALPAGYSLAWFDTLGQRLQMANLMFANAKLRLTIQEAYEVHRSIIDWGQRFSSSKVPDQALGVDPLTLRIMRWGMRDWQRVCIMNRWLGGTLAPRIQMDWLPSVRCAAHVAIIADHPPKAIDDYIAAGGAVQRLWLTLTDLGLQHQPELTPLIFARYGRHGIRFSTAPHADELAGALARRSQGVLGSGLERVVWLGRIGAAAPAQSRSLRLSLDDLVSRHPG